MKSIQGCSFPVTGVQAFVEACFQGMGVSRINSSFAADHLVHTQRREVASHGLRLLPIYNQLIKEGVIRADGKPVFRTGLSQSTLNVDGANILGIITGQLAMIEVIHRAEVHGVAVATIYNTNHPGALGYFVLNAMKQGLVAISTCNTEGFVGGAGSADPLYGSNALAYGFPGIEHSGIFFDAATCPIAFNALMPMHARGEKLPDGMVIERASGEYVHDPKEALYMLRDRTGTFAPLGSTQGAGHKGMGLSLFVSLLSALGGSTFGRGTKPFLCPPLGESTHGKGLGMFLMAMKPADAAKMMVDMHIEEILKASPLPNVTMLYPGQRSLACLSTNRDTVPVQDELVPELKVLADELGIKWPFE